MEPTKEASAVVERKRPNLILALWNNHLAGDLPEGFNPDPVRIEAMQLLIERNQMGLIKSLKEDSRDPSPRIRRTTEKAIVASLGWLYDELSVQFTPEQLTSPPPPPQT